MPPLFANSMSTWMLLAGVAIVTWIVLRWTFKRAGRRKKNEPVLKKLPRPKDGSLSISQSSQDYDRWSVAMHDTARDLAAEIDTKSAALQILIRQAREEREKLEELIERAEQFTTDTEERWRGGTME